MHFVFLKIGFSTFWPLVGSCHKPMRRPTLTPLRPSTLLLAPSLIGAKALSETMSGSLENGRGDFDFRKRFSEISTTVEETGQFCVHGKLDPVPNPLLRVKGRKSLVTAICASFLYRIIDTNHIRTLPFAPGMPDILAWPLPPAQARELVNI
jgi:hypothetical protein